MIINKRNDLNPKPKDKYNSEDITDFRGNKRLFEYSTKEFPQELAHLEKKARQVEKTIQQKRKYGKEIKARKSELKRRKMLEQAREMKYLQDKKKRIQEQLHSEKKPVKGSNAYKQATPKGKEVNR